MESKVLLVDEKWTFPYFVRTLKAKGIDVAILDPTVDFTASTEGFSLRAVVFEPYYVLADGTEHFRPILDGILDRAKKDGAVRIALSSMSADDLLHEGYVLGGNYEHHFRKPSRLEPILNLIR